MKWKYRLSFALVLIFILVVSYIILEPDIQRNDLHKDEIDANDIILSRDLVGLEQNFTLFWGNQTKEQIIRSLIEKFDLDWQQKLHESPWKLAESWVKPREIHPDLVPEMGAILNAISTRKIVAADVGYKGTQLKMSLILAGGQRVAFKPQWFERDHIIKGNPYAGADRHNGEIVAFHLNRILGFRRAPLVAGRVVDLEKEIKPVAEERLLQTFFYRGNNTCFYGKCHYCKSEEDGVCGKGAKLEGAVVLWLPVFIKFKLWRHPWGRTYRSGKTARWEHDDDYCDSVEHIPPYDAGPRLLDILDACVFDYIIGNADRHHYETFKDQDDSMLVMMDSAKSFGNPNHDERSILAPLYQCCRLRQKTWTILQKLKENVLTIVLKKILKKEPIAPILTEEHYTAMDRRLVHIFNEVEKCIKKNGIDNVLVQEHPGLVPFER